MDRVKFILGLTILIGVSSCSSSYKFVNPEKLVFAREEVRTLAPNVTLQYLHPSQLGIKNSNKNQFMIAVKITNARDTAFFLRQPQFKITNSNEELKIVNPRISLKQKKEYGRDYLFHILEDFDITYLKLEIDHQTKLPMLSSTSPHIEKALTDGVINLLASRRSLKKYKHRFVSAVFVKPIQPKESVYGLIPIQGNRAEDLEFSYIVEINN
jgi:hypothetical protein